MKYENRIVLFLDILGFRKHVFDTIEKEKGTGNETDITSKIEELYNILNEMGRITQSYLSNSSLNVTQFSDSIVISFLEDNPENAINTFEIILKIILKLATNNIICRGALSFGKLIHDNKIVFGPALIDAYETESKAAMYPRVIMDKNIYNFSKMYFDNKNQKFVIPEGLSEYLKQDLDSKYYIDYFNAARRVISNNDELIQYYKSLRDIIINGLRFQQPDLKVKYGWLKMKYNSFLNELSKDLFHENVYEYLNKLKLIR